MSKKKKPFEEYEDPLVNKRYTVFEDPEFLALREQWFKILEDEGFEDIERDGRNGQGMSPYLKGPSLVGRMGDVVESGAEFYRGVRDEVRRSLSTPKPMWWYAAGAMLAEGAYSVDIARTVGRSRARIQKVVEEITHRVQHRARNWGTDGAPKG